MSHLWARDDVRGGDWVVLPLELPANRAVRLDARPLRPQRLTKRAIESHVWLIGCETTRDKRWFVLAGRRSPARVNGYPLTTGLRLLEHRDEVHVPQTGRVWFSTEKLAVVEPFPGSDRPTQCARIKTEIERGMPAVRCPGCGTWYSQTDASPGWTYGPTCVMCRHSTDLDAGFRWVPERV